MAPLWTFIRQKQVRGAAAIRSRLRKISFISPTTRRHRMPLCLVRCRRLDLQRIPPFGDERDEIFPRRVSLKGRRLGRPKIAEQVPWRHGELDRDAQAQVVDAELCSSHVLRCAGVG